jgi:PIN domain nuclease of toxin-antitoxin system
MRYLIDTNVFINLIELDYLSDDVLAILTDYDNLIYVSSESIKEFIHLVQAGKIGVKKHIRSLDVFDLIENEFNVQIKYVGEEHLRTLALLDRVEGHNDPSDRLIISQAITENITLISSDAKFPKYRKQGLQLIRNR